MWKLDIRLASLLEDTIGDMHSCRSDDGLIALKINNEI